MPQANVMIIARKVSPVVSIIDIQGEVSAFAEKVLMDAYTEASTSTTSAIILNFSGLEYMNSSGIGLLVPLLIRVHRQKHCLHAFRLSQHYRSSLAINRISEA